MKAIFYDKLGTKLYEKVFDVNHSSYSIKSLLETAYEDVLARTTFTNKGSPSCCCVHENDYAEDSQAPFMTLNIKRLRSGKIKFELADN